MRCDCEVGEFILDELASWHSDSQPHSAPSASMDPHREASIGLPELLQRVADVQRREFLPRKASETLNLLSTRRASRVLLAPEGWARSLSRARNKCIHLMHYGGVTGVYGGILTCIACRETGRPDIGPMANTSVEASLSAPTCQPVMNSQMSKLPTAPMGSCSHVQQQTSLVSVHMGRSLVHALCTVACAGPSLLLGVRCSLPF